MQNDGVFADLILLYMKSVCECFRLYPSQCNIRRSPYSSTLFSAQLVEVQVKFSLEQASKAQRGSRCIALLFLQPRRKTWVGGQPHTLAALLPGKTRYALYRRLGGPQGRAGRVRKISPPTGIRSSYRPTRNESLYRLSYPGQLVGWMSINHK